MPALPHDESSARRTLIAASAAIADLVTAAGNSVELTRERVPRTAAYLGLGAIAVTVVWAFVVLAACMVFVVLFAKPVG
jgi:beta-lactamase regulating signal transducer with metallopeptidase domain